jgi:hypothetical protein
MRNTTSKKTPYGIKFTVNATFPTIAEGILDVEKDSIDSCNLLALAHANHSSRSSITRVSLQHLTIGFRNEKDRATFGAKFECAKAEGNRATDSYDRGLLRAKNNSIMVLPRSPTGDLPPINGTQYDRPPLLPELDGTKPLPDMFQTRSSDSQEGGEDDTSFKW